MTTNNSRRKLGRDNTSGMFFKVISPNDRKELRALIRRNTEIIEEYRTRR